MPRSSKPTVTASSWPGAFSMVASIRLRMSSRNTTSRAAMPMIGQMKNNDNISPALSPIAAPRHPNGAPIAAPIRGSSSA
jgi:hypothetical protein